MKIKIIVVIFVLLITTVSSQSEIYSLAFDVKITNKHKRNTENVEIKSKYKQNASEGKLPFAVTTTDVENWYARISKGYEYTAQYVYYFDLEGGDNYRSVFSSPAGTKRLWETYEEFICNGVNTFLIDHARKHVLVSDNFLSNRIFKNNFFSIKELIFPLKDIDALEPESRYSDTEAIYKSGNELKSVQSIMDDGKKPLSNRTVLRFLRDAMVEDLWVSEIEETENFNGHEFPKRLTIVFCERFVDDRGNPPANQYWHVYGTGHGFDVGQTEVRAIEDYIWKWELELTEVTQIPEAEDFFWYTAPEEYIYQDKRERYNAIWKDFPLQSKENQKLIRGIGSHTFAK